MVELGLVLVNVVVVVVGVVEVVTLVVDFTVDTLELGGLGVVAEVDVDELLP